jgi:hypothetical protein
MYDLENYILDIMLCIPSKISRSFGGTYSFHRQDLRLLLPDSCWFLDVFLYPENGGDILCYIPEDKTLRNHCCESIKAYICSFLGLLAFFRSFHFCAVSAYVPFKLSGQVISFTKFCVSFRTNGLFNITLFNVLLLTIIWRTQR